MPPDADGYNSAAGAHTSNGGTVHGLAQEGSFFKRRITHFARRIAHVDAGYGESVSLKTEHGASTFSLSYLHKFNA